MKTKAVKIDAIRIDGDTQPRVELDQELIAEYADLYEAKVELPPLEVVFDGADHWLVDGFHRRWGADKAGVASLKCNITLGSLDDARWRSYAANQTHGKRRTNEDKRKAVLAALKHPSGVGLSDSQIAEHLGVSVSTVSKYRSELETTFQIGKSTDRTGRDGRTINTANIGKTNGKPKHEAPPEPEIVEPEIDDESETQAEREAIADEPVNPDSLHAVQADLREYESRLRELARFGRKILGAEGGEITRPYCCCYSVLTLIHPLHHAARTVLNDLPVGGDPKNPVLARETVVDQVDE